MQFSLNDYIINLFEDYFRRFFCMNNNVVKHQRRKRFYTVIAAISRFIHKNVVLAIAAVAALITSFIVPPDA